MSHLSEVMRVLVWAVTIGNFVALVAGVALLVAPRDVVKWLGSRSSNPMSVRRLTKPLEKMLDLEGPMLRYSRVLGAALLAGGAFILVKWILFVSGIKSVAAGALLMARMFPDVTWHPVFWEILWVAMSALVLLGALLAVVVGLLALVRTQTLKQLSKLGNRWVSTRRATRSVAKPYYGIDRWIAAQPQLWGGAIALLSLYALAMMVWFTR
jgi:hypothetical protein